MDAGLWLRDLADICRKSGVLLIFDEVMTGFRLGFGGAQEVFSVTPDLVAYGKAIGGGLPLGAVAGHAALMRCFGEDLSAEGIFTQQTFAGNTLAMAAGAAFLDYAHANRTTLYPGLAHMTDRLGAGFNAAAARLGVPAELRHAGSIFRIVLGPQHTRDAETAAYQATVNAFAVMALNSGVLLLPELCGYVSATHTVEHIDRAVQMFATALEDLKADGFFARLEHGTAPRLS
jgi:glutamate-1-semialdehyde aminotransferase